ncbi:MAG: rRNA-processing protein fcf1, partial [Paramarteilia canceri]
VIKSQPVKRLTCQHKGTYADDCIIERITQHKCYVVATCDKELRNRIKKIPGVPMLNVRHGKFTVERMQIGVSGIR